MHEINHTRITPTPFPEGEESSMNLVDAYVTKVLSKPERKQVEQYVWWDVEVEYDSYGRLSERPLSFSTEEAAREVQRGYHFLT